MIFRQLQDPDSSTLTYLIGCEDTRQALIIDPVNHFVQDYLALLSKYELTLAYILDTHIHADHITGSGLLKQQTKALIAMDSHSTATGIDTPLTDSQVLTIGNIHLTHLYTPGHTIESACFLLADRVFTGDTLLINGTGRTDFQNGSAADSYQSIQQKLFSLPDETLLYPGHDYNKRQVSTIGEAKALNPRLSNTSEAEYIAIMDGLNLPRPKHIDTALPLNMACGLDA